MENRVSVWLLRKKKKKQRRDFVAPHHEDAFKRRRSASARLLGFGLVAGLQSLRVSFAGSWIKRTRVGEILVLQSVFVFVAIVLSVQGVSGLYSQAHLHYPLHNVGILNGIAHP